MKKLMLVLSVIPAALYVNGCGGGSDDGGSSTSSASSSSSSGDMSSSSSTSASSSGSSGMMDAGDGGRTDAGDAGRADAGDAGDAGRADAGDAGGDGGMGTCLAPLTGTNPTTPAAEDAAGTFWYGLFGLQWIPTANVLVMSNPFGNAQKGELLKLDPAAANAVTPLRTYAAGEQPIGNAIDATSFLFTSETFHGPGNTATGGRIAKGTTAGAAGAANAFTADNAFYTPHDLAVSGINLFASDPNYLRPTSASNRIMRMVAAGVAPVAATVAKDLGAATHPNGIVATADGLTLYVATNGNASSLAAIRKFPINLDGTLGTEVGAPFIDVAAANGIDAEGLTIDDGGNLYLAVRKTAGPAVQVFRPAGTLIGEITLPATRGTHAHWVTFGGTDRQTLYISVGKNDGTGGGAVYTYRPGCTGPY